MVRGEALMYRRCNKIFRVWWCCTHHARMSPRLFGPEKKKKRKSGQTHYSVSITSTLGCACELELGTEDDRMAFRNDRHIVKEGWKGGRGDQETTKR